MQEVRHEIMCNGYCENKEIGSARVKQIVKIFRSQLRMKILMYTGLHQNLSNSYLHKYHFNTKIYYALLSLPSDLQ